MKNKKRRSDSFHIERCYPKMMYFHALQSEAQEAYQTLKNWGS